MRDEEMGVTACLRAASSVGATPTSWVVLTTLTHKGVPRRAGATVEKVCGQN